MFCLNLNEFLICLLNRNWPLYVTIQYDMSKVIQSNVGGRGKKIIEGAKYASIVLFNEN